MTKHVDAALDLLHLADMAWHDCYGQRELEVPEAVFNDVLLLAGGDLAALIRLARQAVLDFRDVRVAADGKRAGYLASRMRRDRSRRLRNGYARRHCPKRGPVRCQPKIAITLDGAQQLIHAGPAQRITIGAMPDVSAFRGATCEM